MLFTWGMSPACTAITGKTGNGQPKFKFNTLRTAFEKASQEAWTYKRPYKLKGWKDEKSFEQVLERIDGIEAVRIWTLPLMTRM